MISFENTYARLPGHFYTKLAPTPVAAPTLIKSNHPLAVRLGIDPTDLDDPETIASLAGNGVPEGAEPLAMAYAGHQFGGWNPKLGDGRALLLGEVVAPDGERFDLQLKGSGPTPYSRMGDGRAPLGPVLREYIVSEAMAALGVPTTRTLAAVSTGEQVFREGPSPGAVLTRVAASHVRIGTFQYFAARGDTDSVRTLADYVIERHYPELSAHPNPYPDLLRAVVSGTATLIAKWMSLGFIHGVMNTDNMTISGETIDYGPCAFMDEYEPSKVFSSIDQFGRYAYANQPRIAQWNLACFAQCLLELMSADEDEQIRVAQGAIDQFPEMYSEAWLGEMCAKTGLGDQDEEDAQVITTLLEMMADENADFTLTFRGLSDGSAEEQFADKSRFHSWVEAWKTRGGGFSADLNNRNPVFIPRNHQVEAAIAAGLSGDFMPFEKLLSAVTDPFTARSDLMQLAEPPSPAERITRTFCGT